MLVCKVLFTKADSINRGICELERILGCLCVSVLVYRFTFRLTPRSVNMVHLSQLSQLRSPSSDISAPSCFVIQSFILSVNTLRTFQWSKMESSPKFEYTHIGDSDCS